MIQIGELGNHVHLLRAAEGEDWLYHVSRPLGGNEEKAQHTLRTILSFIDKHHHTESILLVDLSGVEALYSSYPQSADDHRNGTDGTSFLIWLNKRLREENIGCIYYGLNEVLKDQIIHSNRRATPGLTLVDNYGQAVETADYLYQNPQEKRAWLDSAETSRFVASLPHMTQGNGTRLVCEQNDDGRMYRITVNQPCINGHDVNAIVAAATMILSSNGERERNKTLIIDLSDVRTADEGLDTMLARTATDMKKWQNNLRLVCGKSLAEKLSQCKTMGAGIFPDMEQAENAQGKSRQ